MTLALICPDENSLAVNMPLRALDNVAVDRVPRYGASADFPQAGARQPVQRSRPSLKPWPMKFESI